VAEFDYNGFLPFYDLLPTLLITIATMRCVLLPGTYVATNILSCNHGDSQEEEGLM